MVRFRVNRSWAFVLALCLFTSCLFLLTSHSSAVASDNPNGFFEGGGDPGGLPPSTGDPDVPAGPGDGRAGKSVVVRGGATAQVVSPTGDRSLGEGMVQTGVVVDRVRLFLLGIRSFYLHF